VERMLAGAIQYPVAMEVKYKTRARTPHVGMGETRWISSREVTFTTDHPMEPGTRLEICIAWPALLNDRVALQLVVEAEIVRGAETEMTARILKHHFRTRGPWQRQESVRRPLVACATAIPARAIPARAEESLCAS
jgi:hypothetical protein